MNAHRIYQGSNGGLTRSFYSALEKRGPAGIVAMNLFRAQKCSKRAKKYGSYSGIGDRSYREMAYEGFAQEPKQKPC